MINKKYVDFSKHKHVVELYKCGDKEIRVDKLFLENSCYDYVIFINSNNNLSVVGDYSNWIFNRPFIPSTRGGFSCDYWLEKLQVGNGLELTSLDMTKIKSEFEELIQNLDEYITEDKKELFMDIYDSIDFSDEFDYIAKSRELPIDCENIPYHVKIPVHFYIIGEAFDEICRRLKVVEEVKS